ncbi:MAG: hypothetical protein R2681_01350 [Pyrinomonadaceae bacterium]
MPNSLQNHEFLKRFLYGELPEDERFEFEQKVVSDASVFEEVKAFEDDLIERYVRGWMDPAQMSEFELKFLTTGKRRERVEFSRVLIDKVFNLKKPEISAAIQTAAAANNSFAEKIRAFLFDPKIALTAASAIAALAFGGWIVYQNFSGGRNEIVKNPDTVSAETPNSTFSPTPAVLPEDSVEKDDKIDNNSPANEIDSNEVADKSGDQGTVKTPEPEKNEPAIQKTPVKIKTPILPGTVNPPSPVIALIPGLVRSDGKISELKLPAGARGATLSLDLQRVDYEIYLARLTDANGNLIYQKGNLKVRGAKVNVFITSNNLKKGDYILRLYGRNTDGENESAADYQFRVN